MKQEKWNKKEKIKLKICDAQSNKFPASKIVSVKFNKRRKRNTKKNRASGVRLKTFYVTLLSLSFNRFENVQVNTHRIWHRETF